MIGKTIKSLLAADSTLVSLVGTKVYPYVMNENTALPAVVYTIDSVSPEYNKNGWALDDIEFSVHCFAKDYEQLQSVVSAVRGALELKLTGSGTQDINHIYLSGQDEGFDGGEDVYINSLKFRVKINSY